MDMEIDESYAKKPRKTQRGQFKKRRKPMQMSIQTHTHSNKRATEIFVSFS